jgi:type II secretory pathway pseudopilin PulG
VLVATVVLVVAALAVISMCVRSNRLRTANHETLLALTACRSVLEGVRSQSFADVPGLDGRGFDVPGNNGGPGGLRPPSGDADGLPGQLRVAEVATQAGETLYQVTALVQWLGCEGARTFQLQTMVADRSFP